MLFANLTTYSSEKGIQKVITLSVDGYGKTFLKKEWVTPMRSNIDKNSKVYLKKFVIETLHIEQDGDALTYIAPMAINVPRKRGSAEGVKAWESGWEVRNDFLAKLKNQLFPIWWMPPVFVFPRYFFFGLSKKTYI